MRALSIRQPWAELIMRGQKTIEYRTRVTHIRGQVHIYASLGRYHPDDEAEWADEFGVDVAQLPRGVVVGTVELIDCVPDDDGFRWCLSNPTRACELRKPDRHPQPVWFNPFSNET